MRSPATRPVLHLLRSQVWPWTLDPAAFVSKCWDYRRVPPWHHVTIPPIFSLLNIVKRHESLGVMHIFLLPKEGSLKTTCWARAPFIFMSLSLHCSKRWATVCMILLCSWEEFHSLPAKPYVLQVSFRLPWSLPFCAVIIQIEGEHVVCGTETPGCTDSLASIFLLSPMSFQACLKVPKPDILCRPVLFFLSLKK